MQSPARGDAASATASIRIVSSGTRVALPVATADGAILQVAQPGMAASWFLTVQSSQDVTLGAATLPAAQHLVLARASGAEASAARAVGLAVSAAGSASATLTATLAAGP